MAALASQVVFNKLFQLAVVSHKGSMPDIHRKHTKVMDKILVAGKSDLTLGVRRPGEKPSWGGGRQDRVFLGVRPISSSY